MFLTIDPATTDDERESIFIQEPVDDPRNAWQSTLAL
jgi:hypothetical protein